MCGCERRTGVDRRGVERDDREDRRGKMCHVQFGLLPVCASSTNTHVHDNTLLYERSPFTSSVIPGIPKPVHQDEMRVLSTVDSQKLSQSRVRRYKMEMEQRIRMYGYGMGRPATVFVVCVHLTDPRRFRSDFRFSLHFTETRLSAVHQLGSSAHRIHRILHGLRGGSEQEEGCCCCRCRR